MTAVVRVADLRAHAAGQLLLDGVGFSLPAGQVLALVGASGSGKTTTGRALLGEHSPGVSLSGHVEVHGSVGFVPQQPASALNPVRRLDTVFREIAAVHDGDGGDLVARALHRARVPATLLRRYPHQLSGGQQQRVVLAQALVGNPAVLVADEPTTGQDTLTRADLVAELSAIVGHGVALVLLTHDVGLVRALADHIVVLRAGRVVEAGPARDLLTRPREDYTRALLDAEPTVPAVVRREAPRLRVRRLTARYGSCTVLRNVDLEIGGRLAVVGRSGSGKTTLGRCLVGLHRQTSGSVLLHGRPLASSLRRRPRADLAAVQYVFQDARESFDEHRAVLHQVARTAVRLRGVPASTARTAALAALAEVGLDEKTVLRRPRGLSGGELQRAALVRALLAEPEVLVCDEITSGLDAVTRGRLLDLLARAPCALVLISHDLDVVARLADRIAVLHEGRVVAHGPVASTLDMCRERMT